MNTNRTLALLGRIRRAYEGDTLAGVLARGGTWSFGFRVATAGIATLAQITLVSVLGDEDYGRYTYVLGWLNIAVVFTVFNFDYVSVKYVSMYASSRCWELLRGFEQTATRFAALLSTFAGAVLAAIIWWRAPRLDASLVVPALIACVMLPVYTAVIVASYRLRGRKLIAQSHVHEVLRPAILLSVVAVAAFLLGQSLDLVRVFIISFCALSIATVVTALIARQASATSRNVAPRYKHREWFGAAVGLLPASFAQLALGSTTDIVIVGTLVGTTAAGVYSIAVMLLRPLGFVPLSMGAIAGPMIADLYANKRIAELRRLMVLVACVNIGFTVPAVVGLYLISPMVLSWLGPTFRSGYPIVLLLGISAISATLGGHAALMLTMTGHHNRASMIIGASAILNLALAIALGYSLGVVGVAAATMIASVTRNVSLTVAATRRIGVSLMPF